MKKTRRSLFTSIAVLLLCSAMFVGSTFAWFTDTVSNTGNKIQAGTLKIGLEKYNTSTSSFDDITTSTTPIFDYDKWEPGYSDVALLKVTNNGNLALKFNMNIVVNGEVAKNSQGHTLADAIDVYTKINAQDSDIPTTFPGEAALIADGWTKTSLTALLADGDGAAHGVLLPTDETPGTYPVGNVTCGLILHMQEEAGNEFQGMELGAAFDIRLNATQFTYEKDGFDSDQYDALANLPVVAAFEPVSEADVQTDSTKTLKIKEKGAVKEAEVQAKDTKTVFDNLKQQTGADEGDSNSLTLTLNVDKIGEEVKDVEAGKEYTTNLDISMEGTMITIKGGADGTKVVKTEDVKQLDGFVTIKLDLAGTEYDEVLVKHNGNAMQELASADATPTDVVNGGFYYDSTNNVVIVKTKTFSPFTVIGTKSNMPKKGTLIKMDLVPTETTIYPVDSCPIGDDGKETYRILKTEGNQALVLAMYDATEAISMYDIGSSAPQDTFDNNSKYLKYNGSLVDTALNTTFYGKLTDDAKGAIVPTIIKQGAYSKPENTSGSLKYDYYYSSNINKYSTDRITEVTIGERNVFALDMEDVFNYLGNEATIDKIINMYYNENFNNARSNDAHFAWLRSANTNRTKYGWGVLYGKSFSGLNANGADYGSGFSNGPICARPSFYIDLTKIDWAKAE